MFKKVSLFMLLLSFLSMNSYATGSDGIIEISVSPIKFDIVMNPGESTTQTVKFYNKDVNSSTFTLSAADCVAGVDYGTPKCTPSASVLDPIHASSWITFSGPTTLTIPPNSEKIVQFTVHAPSNAVPGGHYGAIFFNNPLGGPVANAVTTAYRIGPLFLIKINGDIVYNTSLGDISVSGPVAGPGGGGSSGLSSFGFPTSLSELFQSAPDLSKINWNKLGASIQEELNPFWDKPNLPKDAFLFTFDIPLTNSGNTHIKPTGRIEIFDDDGNPLKSIGKETVKNKDGVFLGERIVDYLPINDEEGNILPNTSRNFPIEWKGFAYEGIEDGKAVIKFQTPSAYYSQQVEEGNQFLWPWERMRLVKNNKHLRAQVSLEYVGKDGKLVPLETQKEIQAEYLAITKTLNYGVIVPFILVVLIFLLLLRRRGNKIEELEEEIDVYEDEVDEFEHARDMAKKALEKKELKKVNSKKDTSIKRTRTKKVITPNSTPDTQDSLTEGQEDAKKKEEIESTSKKTEDTPIVPPVKKRTSRKTVKPE